MNKNNELYKINNFKNGYLSIIDLVKYYNNDIDLTLKRLEYYGIDLLDFDFKEIEKIKEVNKSEKI